MRKVVYLAGPISHPDFMQAMRNLHWFFEMEIMLKRSGYAVINPAADFMALIMAGDFEKAEVLDCDESLVKKSDAVFVHYDWVDSDGAKKEYGWAAEDGIPIAHTINDLHEIFEDDWVADLPMRPDD